MRASPVEAEAIDQLASEILKDYSRTLLAVDISFYKDGEEIFPRKDISVTIYTEAFQEIQGDENTALLHITHSEEAGQSAELLEHASGEDGGVSFRTGDFPEEQGQ